MLNYRIRLSTLFWIVTAGCCFLAGQQWHRRDAILAGVSEIIVIDDGQSYLLTMEKRIPLVTVDDPSILDVNPLSPREMLIVGRKPGVTNLEITTEDKQTTSYQIKVLGPTAVVVQSTQSAAEFLGNF